ncbi:HDL544Cp [Eremothecium sinecaudum]|uniref:Signal peptidase subunit 3 n=1 Tax=Eremothecium sinecaudum TaxID=45286 RepID=A0A0X8HRN5_9SACH|nr:HDL544Cp [Eremothecium sinecaudum]AMD20200.1 HDL544Cp [Eremothecium sinecaudum]
MFSLFKRFSVVSSTALSFAFFAGAFVVLSFWFELYRSNVFSIDSSIDNIKPSINVRTSRYFGSISGKPKENVKLTFDLDADLTNLFNWNTKQVFVYLTAEYSGAKKPDTSSEVTFWDQIVKDKDHANLSLRNVKSKYSVWDIEDKISERDLTFKLHWNIQPWVGNLVYGSTLSAHNISIEPRDTNSRSSSNDGRSAKKIRNKIAKQN